MNGTKSEHGHRDYRVEGGKQRVELRGGGEQAVEAARGDETDVERRRRRRDHAERVLHAHEEQKPRREHARQPMVPRHVAHVLRPPRHEPRPLFLVLRLLIAAVDARALPVHVDGGAGFPRSSVAERDGDGGG